MSMPYEATGRVGQKARTRQALVDATRRLLADGQTPQVEEAAEAAGISRTTAYRYFPNQRLLLMAAHPEISPDSLLGPDAPATLPDRLDAFMAAFCEYNFTWEPQLRAALRVSLEPEAERPTLRQGRAVRWIEDALAPLRETHPELDVHALAVAIRSAVGIEALIWLLDVAGYGHAEAARTVRETARALVAAATREV
ncbi:MAG: TetR/AcrR family transcriptional regulator [Hamadaea sp.]|uniref:TetR/AcrR family transcriptional regulator n=1 Tax=Hamadaea sp. TaxID=2024425 RepID=UPI0018185AE3|nr:TetR/AcrR family transcriptional regulator [Hamadaea sp.]NUR71033.1 TetR/AcrR family transcriptional regulator [Hamadaea sp.]NUT23714.1 TetR/AcrR family transcriptional regulator [Hamadaea sp.]